MKVTLSPEAQKLLEKKMESGAYESASDVLEDALLALYERDSKEYRETVEAIRRGLESAERGEGRPAEEFFDEMRQKHGIPR
jgi:putative addiction module CopG family antidote